MPREVRQVLNGDDIRSGRASVLHGLIDEIFPWSRSMANSGFISSAVEFRAYWTSRTLRNDLPIWLKASKRAAASSATNAIPGVAQSA